MSAHLAVVTASLTTLPVLGVPTESKLKGLDSLLSTVQMPSGIPVGTLAIGKAGAINAAYLSKRILDLLDDKLSYTEQAREYARAREFAPVTGAIDPDLD